MRLREPAGFSLTEMLVAVAVAGIIIAAAISIVVPMLKLKNQIDTNSGLHLVTSYMRSCVANDEAWRNTVLDTANTTLACLRNNTDCLHGTTGRIRLKSSTNELCYLDHDTIEGSPTGFTRDGASCDGFNATAGNDQCPFRYNVTWTARCPFNEPRCPNPLVTVEGKMAYSPKPGTRITELNLDKFNMRAVRGRADQTRYFAVYETKPQGVEGGECPAGGQYRKFTQESDPGDYVRLVDPNTGAIILEPGTYSCRISVPGYLVGNHKAILRNFNLGSAILQGTSEYSPGFWGFVQTRSEIVGTFTLTDPTAVGVFHVCTSQPVDPALKRQSLGVPTGAGVELYSVFECAVIARSAR